MRQDNINIFEISIGLDPQNKNDGETREIHVSANKRQSTEKQDSESVNISYDALTGEQLKDPIIDRKGKALYKAIFSGHIADAFQQVLSGRKENQHTQVRFKISDPELALLPWEAMNDGENFLAARSDISFVRELPVEKGSPIAQKLRVRGPLRILFVGASPEGLEPLDIQEAERQLREAMADLIKKKRVVLDALSNASKEDLHRTLLSNYHVLYFVGHGGPEGIYLDDGEGDLDPQTGQRLPGDQYLLTAESFARELSGKSVRLVYLAACGTSTPGENKNISFGLTHELVRLSKVPAVVGMQYAIGDLSATWFASAFFDGIARFRPVDVAFSEARQLLIQKGQCGRDMVAPVLYLQAEDGALFQRDRNREAITLGVLFLFTILIGAYLIFTVEKGRQHEQIKRLQAQSTANAEATSRVLAQSTAMVESTMRAFAQQTAQAGIIAKNNAENIALSRELASEAKKHLNNQYDLSLLLSVDAYKFLDTLEAKSNLISTLQYYPYLLKILPKNSDTQTQVLAFDNSDAIMAAGDDKGFIFIWDLNTFQLIGPPLKRNDTAIKCLSFSPDGKILAAGGADGNVVLWDLKSKKAYAVFLALNDSEVQLIKFDPEAKFLTSTYRDGSIRVWNLSTGNPIYENMMDTGDNIAGNKHGAWGSYLSQDGRYLFILSEFCGSMAPECELQRLDTQNINLNLPPMNINKYYDFITSYTFSQDGNILITGGCNHGTGATLPCLEGRIDIFDTQTGKPLGSPLVGHQGSVEFLALSPDKKTLVSVGGWFSNQWTLIFWDISSDKPIGDPIPIPQISAIGLSNNGSLLVTTVSDGRIMVWQVKKGITNLPNVEIQEIQERKEFGLLYYSGCTFHGEFCAYALQNSKSKENILTVTTSRPGFTGDTHTYDFTPAGGLYINIVQSNDQYLLKNPSLEQDILLPLKDKIETVNINPNGRILEISSYDNALFLFDIMKMQALKYDFGSFSQESIQKVIISHNGQYILIKYSDNIIRVWDTIAGSPIYLGEFDYENPGSDVDYQVGDDSKALIIRDDEYITLWRLDTLNKIGQFPIPDGDVNKITYNLDAQLIAIGYTRDTDPVDNILILDMLNGKTLGILTNQSRPTFSTQGELIASYDAPENELKLWDAKTGKYVLSLEKTSNISGGSWWFNISFSPDDKFLVFTNYSHSLEIWETDSGALVGQFSVLGELSSFTFVDNGNGIVAGGCSQMMYNIGALCEVGELHNWPFGYNSWNIEACQIAGRDMTIDEWDMLIPEQPYHKTCP